jgi:hypothetical protein
LQIKPLSEHVGAEISGVNLAAHLEDNTFEKIDDAYNRYSVLVFRDQKLTPEQQIAFARRFGELEISPRRQFALPGHPEILVLSNIIENGKPIGNADAGRTWHTDMSYTKTPPRGSLLYALEIPIENGCALGDTVFASAAAAFDVAGTGNVAWSSSRCLRFPSWLARDPPRKRQEIRPRQQAGRSGQGHPRRRASRHTDAPRHRTKSHLRARGRMHRDLRQTGRARPAPHQGACGHGHTAGILLPASVAPRRLADVGQQHDSASGNQ